MKEYLRELVRDLSIPWGRNAAREYFQARILEALQRSGAMTSLAFQGGTCLRFLFSLPRHSEDLDFALENPRGYDLRSYLGAVRSALQAEDYAVDIRLRQQRTVHSVVVRLPGILYELGLSPHASEVVAIKIEVDTRPPAGALTAVSLVRRHVTLRLFHHDRSSLLAGKLHAVMQRPYAKGRDMYDLVWYLGDPDWPEPNLTLLNAALGQSGWRGPEMTAGTWPECVMQRLQALDWKRVAADVGPFLERDEDLALVSRDNAMTLVAARRV